MLFSPPIIPWPLRAQKFKPTASQATAAAAEAVTLETGRALFFARGVLHEASVSADNPGRCLLFVCSHISPIVNHQLCFHDAFTHRDSVHVTVGIDTQDITWQHAIHAFIDSQPPVFPALFFSSLNYLKPFIGTRACIQSGSIRLSSSCCYCNGAVPALLASSPSAAAAAAAACYLLAIIYPFERKGGCFIVFPP